MRVALLALACSPAPPPDTGTTPTSSPTDTGITDTGTADTGTADTGTPGTDTGSTTSPTALVAEIDALVCDYEAYYSPPPEELTASYAGGGEVSVSHQMFEWACAPEVTITATLDATATTIDVAYDLYDPLDCVCAYSIEYTLLDVPSGTWTIIADIVQDTVVVP